MPNPRPVCIVAPFGRDAESIASLLASQGHRPVIRPSVAALADALGEDTGMVVLTEEAIFADTDTLGPALARQEAWSDIPFLLLRASHSGLGRRVALPAEVTNVIELERPLSSASLVSAVSTALRAREKQFLVRDQMKRLADSEARLSESEAELRLIADSLPVLIGFIGTDLTYRFANLAYEDWFGVPITEILGKSVRQVIGEEEWVGRKDAIERALSGRPVRMEVSWPRFDGRRREAEIRYLPRFAPTGAVDGFHVFATDVTVRKVALEATQQQAALLEARVIERTAELHAEMAARAASDEALRQAQKMEAVGQLTGGIAHDFNNMLTGILTAHDLMRMRIEQHDTSSLGRLLDVASTSAHRAASLTQRLLAFSRRQTLDSRPVDVNAMVRSMVELLRRTLGEGVDLVCELEEDLLPALVDLNQLESALLNLAINARDAMVGQGRMGVRTGAADVAEGDTLGPSRSPVRPGRYVCLAVTDTGSGMPPEVIDHIFEPFFTTKPIGQGTGLGMSMIYGFMQQSNGHVTIESTVGQGTTVHLWLPVADAEAAAASDELGDIIEGGGEQLLVVEDDEQVRILVTEMLQALGYIVHAFASADEALPVLASIRPVDLLVTDVGLPGLNGRQLAEIARQSRPGLPVLFVTGYAEGATTRAEFLDAGMGMIAKPFVVEEFSQTVRRMLAGH